MDSYIIIAEKNERIGSGRGKWKSIAINRMMSSILGMIVSREREIAEFEEETFYTVLADTGFENEWLIIGTSSFYNSPLLINGLGFKERKNASLLKSSLEKVPALRVKSVKTEEKRENAPLLYNLASLQAVCCSKYNLSPEQTLQVAEELYKMKLITWPKTSAKVLTPEVASNLKPILNGLVKQEYKKDMLMKVAQNGWHKNIEVSCYTDSAGTATTHAIIPTGAATDELEKLTDIQQKVYHDIVTRFLCIFYPPAVYEQAQVILEQSMWEQFSSIQKTVKEYGYLEALDERPEKKDNLLADLEEGQELEATYEIVERKTVKPMRHTSGSVILSMDNARAMEAIHKLIADGYLALELNTQVLAPLPLGEDVYDILMDALPEMLSLDIKKEENEVVEIPDEKNGDLPEEEVRATEDEENTTVQPKEAHMERIKCPLCEKGYVFEHDKGYGCTAFKSGCKFTLWKKVAGKLLTTSQVEKLVKGETTEVIRGFTNKDGKKFDAALRFQNGKVKFVFQKGNK